MAKSEDRSNAARGPLSAPAREARLAAALRANLVRRKAAVRAAASAQGPSDAVDEPSR
jgi:hypothetical protein